MESEGSAVDAGIDLSKPSPCPARWPHSLLRELVERKCVIIIGAGLSAQSWSTSFPPKNPPDWVSLIRNVSKLCLDEGALREVTELVDRGSLTEAVNLLQSRSGPQDYEDALHEELVKPRFKPAPAHESLVEIDQHVVISLNFDTIYESLCRAGNEQDYSVISATDNVLGKSLRGPRRTIYKMHGTATTPGTTVFSSRDYLRRAGGGNDDAILEALFMTRTVLFLGCGFSGDPDIELLLEKSKKTGGDQYPHYALIHNSKLQSLGRTFQEYGLQPISYGSEEHPENHSDFTTSLVELAKAIRSERGYAT